MFNCLSSQGKGNREQLPLVICVQWTSAALPCFFPCETLWSSIFNSNVLSTWNCGSWEAFLEKWTATLGSMGVVIKSPNSTQASFTLYAATRACRFFLTPVEVAVVPGREIHQWGYGRKLNMFFPYFFSMPQGCPDVNLSCSWSKMHLNMHLYCDIQLTEKNTWKTRFSWVGILQVFG